MKHFRFFLMTCMLTVSSAMVAQNTTVRGVVMDKSLGEGAAFATVKVYKPGKDSTVVAAFQTDVDGVFNKDIVGAGEHNMIISSVGKANYEKTITLGVDSLLDLGTIFLEDGEHALQSVEVVAQKPLVKMEVDKMTYRVEDDNDAKSSTVLDMLRKVPMVTVDGQDNISVNGSSSFKVYVDGKPNPMFSSNPSMIFKSMPASMVKNIEVITNPGAKYDAEGATGVLNIILNKETATSANMNGFNGTIRAQAGNKAQGGSVFVSGQQDKLSYSANVMVSYTKPGTPTVEGEQQNGSTIINSLAETKTKLPFVMSNISLGYDVDKMSSINTSLALMSMNMRNNATNTTTMSGLGFIDGFSYGSNIKMKEKMTSLTWNIDYQRFFNSERTNSITLSYQLDHNPSRNEQKNDFFGGEMGTAIDLTDRLSVSDNATTEHTVQVDYTTALAEGQTINVGAKAMSRRASTDSKYYLNDVLTQNMGMDYLYKNSILAGYTEYEGKWGNWGTKAGLRYEHTWQDVEYKSGHGVDFSKNYGSFVPAASVSYSLAPTQNIGLTYNMRISRPGITYLNPYVDHSDPNSLTYGNTNLDIEKSHNVQLVYNQYSAKLMMNVSLRHNYTGNAIDQYSFYQDGLLHTTFGNIVQRNQTGLNLYANWMATNTTRLFLNGGVSYVDLRSDKLDYSNSGWQGNLMAGLQQTLPLDIKLGAYMITSTKSYNLQGWSSGFNILTANLSKSFLNDKLTVSVMGTTGLSDKGCIKMETYSKGSDFLSHQTIKIPISSVSLSISYTFGKSRMQKQHVSKIQNDYIEQQSQGEMYNSIGSGSGTGAGAGAGAGMPM